MDAHPEAGDDWTTKAQLLGADIDIDHSVWGIFRAAKIPGGKEYFGVTQARASRKLVRSIIGDVI